MLSAAKQATHRPFNYPGDASVDVTNRKAKAAQVVGESGRRTWLIGASLQIGDYIIR
jgi:hypothetical protein